MNSLNFCSNRNFIISGSWDKSIRFYNLFSGENVLTLFDHQKKVNCLALSFYEKYIISSDEDNIKIRSLFIL